MKVRRLVSCTYVCIADQGRNAYFDGRLNWRKRYTGCCTIWSLRPRRRAAQ